VHARRDEAGSETIDLDPIWRHLDRDAFGEANDPDLAARIGGVVRKRSRSATAREEDDASATARLHARARRAHDVERPEQIHANGFKPSGRLRSEDAADPAQDGRGVNDRVERSETLADTVHRTFARGRLRNVGHDPADSFAPERFGQPPRLRLQRDLRAGTDDHVGAGLQECLGAGQTDPAASPRDECVLVTQHRFDAPSPFRATGSSRDRSRYAHNRRANRSTKDARSCGKPQGRRPQRAQPEKRPFQNR